MRTTTRSPRSWAALSALLLSFASAARAQYPSLKSADTRTLPPSSVVTGGRSWGADLNFGGNFNRGNADVDYVAGGFDLFRSFPGSGATAYLSGSAIYNTFNGATAIDQRSLAARLDYPVAGPWRALVFTTHGYNQFIKLDYRETAGAGPWYDLALGPTTHGLSLAAVQEYEEFQGRVFARQGRWSLRDVSRFPLSQVAWLGADLFYVPRMDDFGDYYASLQLSLETLVWKENLGLKVSWMDEYESRPQPGVKSTDIITTTALTLHFGR